MRPNYHPKGLFDENKVSNTEKPKQRSNPITQLWHMNGKCPQGTIPIRRTKEEDVLRASSVKRYGKKKHRAIPQPRSADPDFINESGHQVIHIIGVYFFPFFFPLNNLTHSCYLFILTFFCVFVCLACCGVISMQ